jgi:hypothetical protein
MEMFPTKLVHCSKKHMRDADTVCRTGTTREGLAMSPNARLYRVQLLHLGT